VGKLSFNWSTGEWEGRLLHIQLLGASVFKMGLYSPWIFGVSLPLGAVLFLVNRKDLAVPAPPARPTTPPVQ
jgi:hypothetical protein